MAKKKHTPISISAEDNAQAQHLFEHYHQIASSLHTSTDQKEVETVLAEINTLSESAQMALLKELSKEHHTDAADILIAIHELGPMKEVRKEAKRSLIRLEEAKIYPQWEPPTSPALALLTPASPLRFWKGEVTDSRDVGEVNLILCFEQGNGEIRILGFLLEFWYEGVKDFFTRVETKRSIDSFITEMTKLYGVKTKACSLAHGRRLLLDALAVNQKLGTLPHGDYRQNQRLVKQLVLDAPVLEEEDADEDIDLDEKERINLKGLNPQEVVAHFIDYWYEGNYDVVYDLLSSDSNIREGLDRDEWVDRRDAWNDAANPDGLEATFIHEREEQKSGIWLPNPFVVQRSATRKEFDVGWSIEMDETPLSDTLPELPKATVIYEETGRNWFWSSYALVQEDSEWRIQSIIDEGTNAQGLPIAELRKRIEEHDKQLQDITNKHKPTDPDSAQYVPIVTWHFIQPLYYCDALIRKMPLDRAIYENTAARALSFVEYERCTAYLEEVTQRFTERRALNLRGLAAVRQQLSYQYSEKGDDERSNRSLELAAEALRETLALQDSWEAHISLAEALITRNDHLEEAEDHLLQAKALVTDPVDDAHIELHLGEIAEEHEQYEEALKHYQRVVAFDPKDVTTWISIADVYKKMEKLAEAETSYKRAIELEPENADHYYTLSRLYSENGQSEKAIEIIEEGLSVNPESAVLNVYLASIYLESHDYRQAELFLERAERIDPELEVLPMFHQILTLERSLQQNTATNKLSGPKLSRPKKKKGR